eukprot:Em0017g622a
MEIDQTDQLGDDGDMDDEDDADESDEERTADPNFFVPTYENEPDPNDIFGLKWGRTMPIGKGIYQKSCERNGTYNKNDPVWKKIVYFFGTFLPLKNALKLMQIGLYSIAMIWCWRYFIISWR